MLATLSEEIAKPSEQRSGGFSICAGRRPISPSLTQDAATEAKQMMKVVERFENTPRALKKKLEELSELENEIRKSEEDAENVNGMIQEELLRWAELQKLIRDAQHTRKDERKARAKAEALGRLIERIEVFFVPTGKKYPQSVPETVVIVPKSGPPVRYDVSC